MLVFAAAVIVSLSTAFQIMSPLWKSPLVCDASPGGLFSRGIFLASFQHTCTDMCLVPSKFSGALEFTVFRKLTV